MALLIFLFTYAVIGLGSIPGLRIDRPTAALLGAIAMVLCRVLPAGEAFASIDLATIALLLGLMLLAGTLADAGFFELVARDALRFTHSARGLLGAVVAASGILSALFLNDAVCLLFTPLVLLLTKRAGRRPLPYLLGVATASNVGGACTISGNPQNALIGLKSGIGYGEFALRLLPASAIGLVITWAVIAFVYRLELREPATPPPPESVAPVHRTRLILGLLCALGMLVAFVARVDVGLAALGFGVLAVVLAGDRKTPFARVDLPLLLLFAGLFVVTAGVRVSGIAEVITSRLDPALAAPNVTRVASLSGIALVLSNLVSNVPAVMLLSPSLSAAGSHQAWLTLAMASTFAGNLTLVGSIANLIVAQLAAREAPISFVEYLKVGVPLTFLTLLLGIAILCTQPFP